MSHTRKKIALLILGGTVLTEEDPAKNAVVLEKDVKSWLRKIPEIKIMADIEPIFILGEKDKEPKLDHWTKTAKLIADRIKTHDGFVITHHAYSLLYAACAFSFMLQGVNKPVVFTGSQIPLFSAQELTDQETFKKYKGLGIKANLINAIQVAIQGPREVTIMFGNKLVQANQARQMKSLSLNLFDAPPKAVLGMIDFGIKISDFYPKQKVKTPFVFKTKFDRQIAVLRLYPEANQNLFKGILQKKPSAILVQCDDRELSLSQLKKILKPKNTIPIVIHTAFPFPQNEATSLFMVSNMTFETTLIKFMWILGQTKDKKRIGKLLKTNLANEIIEEENQ